MPHLTVAPQVYYAPLIILAEAALRPCSMKTERDMVEYDWLFLR